MKRIHFAGALLILGAVAGLRAAVPNLINFQGRLTNSGGVPITTNQAIAFSLFDAPSAGTQVFTEVQNVTPDSAGIYTAFIGAVNSLAAVNFNQPLWLQVSVNGTPLTPRYQLATSPYAFRAALANDVANGSIDNADVSPAAGILLSKLEKDPSTAGAINVSTNPVDWTKLKNVPAGFADGTDNTGAGAASVEENDAVVEPALSILDFSGAFSVTSSPAGEANVGLDASSVTLQGNSFNAAGQLVQLDGAARLPAVDGSLLTNIGAGAIAANSVGTAQIANSTVALADLNTADIDTRYVTTGTAQAINGVKTLNADWVNTANPWADNEVANVLTLGAGSSVDSSALDSSSVTKQGNSFNAAGQLVRLDASSRLPAVDGSQLINVAASAAAANSIGTSQIINSTVALADLNAADVDTRYVTTGTVQTISGAKTLSGNWVNTANPWADDEVSDTLTLGAASAVSPSAISAGALDADVVVSSVALGAVGGSQVLDGSLADADLSAGAAIQLSKLEKDPSTAGAINASTNPVDWTKLKNVPAGFADGTDNTGAGATSVEVDDAAVEPTLATLDFLGAHFNATSSPAGEVNVALDASSVTLQGNVFNAANQLVRLDGTSRLPAVDGSQLINVAATGVAANSIGTSQIINSTVALVDLNTADIDTRYVTTGTAQTINGAKTLNANWVNTANPWADDEVSDVLTLGAGSDVDSSALDSSSVTKQGNSFNAANQLVRLDGTSRLPAVDGSQLINVAAAGVAANSVGTSQIINSTVALADLNTADIDTRYVTTGTAQTLSGIKTFSNGLAASGGSIGAGTASPNVRLDVNGDLAIRAKALTALSAGNNDDFNAGAFSFNRVASDASGSSITGISGGQDGKVLVIYNTANDLTISNLNGGSSSANQIRTGTGADITTTGEGSVTLIYDDSLNKWLVTSFQP